MSETASATIDDLNELVCTLAHPVRRTVIRQFAANPAGTTLEELAAIVAEAEPGVTETAESEAGEAAMDGVEAGGAERAEAKPAAQPPLRELRIALHHVHLPKLEEAGLLTYDEERSLIETTRYDQAGSRRWQAVAAVDGVLSLVESDAQDADLTGADERLQAN